LADILISVSCCFSCRLVILSPGRHRRWTEDDIGEAHDLVEIVTDDGFVHEDVDYSDIVCYNVVRIPEFDKLYFGGLKRMHATSAHTLY